MSTVIKNILVIVVVAAGAYGVFYAVNEAHLLSGTVLRAEDVDQKANEIQQGLIADMTQLNTLSLNGSMFQSDAYKSLVDTEVTLPAFPVSRQNPFDPI